MSVPVPAGAAGAIPAEATALHDLDADAAIDAVVTRLGITAPGWRREILRELCEAVATATRDRLTGDGPALEARDALAKMIRGKTYTPESAVRSILAAADIYAARAAADARDQHRAERDLMHDDLGDLLEATAQGNYARPESPHEVTQSAIARVLEIRAVCTDAVKLTVTQGNRVAELEQLAAEMLASHAAINASGEEHEAFADDTQIAKWETALKGTP